MFALKTISRQLLAVLTLGMCSLTAMADDASIRKNLAERLPNLPAIDEISKTPMAGLFEVRVNGTDIFYTDADGNFLIQGSVFDTKARANLTEIRTTKLSAIDFDKLPLKDAFTIVRGNGKRKIAVFEDPNCGYCKRFERDMQKSNSLWCAKDKAKAWQDYMVRDVAIAAAPTCDTSALTRNVEFGKKNKITGTPTMFFADGTRVPGAIDSAQVEKLLASIK